MKCDFDGRIIKSIQRRGKYMIFNTNGEQALLVHLGMSGRFTVHAKGQEYHRAEHDHVVFILGNGARVVYNDARRFGFMIPVSQANWQTEAPFASMGPEPLSEDFTAPALLKRLKARRTPIKVALLDQSVVAGIGNIYASEALFEARIDPRKPAFDLSVKEAEALTSAIQSVLLRAIEAGGSTLKDYRHADGALGYFQHHFAVYDREKEPCPGCLCDFISTGGIQRLAQSGRTTYFCPHMQAHKMIALKKREKR